MRTSYLTVYLILLFALTLPLVSCSKLDLDTPVGNNNRIDMVIDSVSAVLFTEAHVYSRIVDIKNHHITRFGFCWDTLVYPSIDDRYVDYGALEKARNFDTLVENLYLEKTHYIRMFAVSGNIVAYSNQVSFRTYYGIPIPPDIVETTSVTGITTVSAVAGGKILNEGINVSFTEHGHCWAAGNNQPTLNNSKTQFGSVTSGGTYLYNSTLPGLSTGTTYFTRAYGITLAGDTLLGNVLSFTTN